MDTFLKIYLGFFQLHFVNPRYFPLKNCEKHWKLDIQAFNRSKHSGIVSLCKLIFEDRIALIRWLGENEFGGLKLFGGNKKISQISINSIISIFNIQIEFRMKCSLAASCRVPHEFTRIEWHQKIVMMANCNEILGLPNAEWYQMQMAFCTLSIMCEQVKENHQYNSHPPYPLHTCVGAHSFEYNVRLAGLR